VITSQFYLFSDSVRVSLLNKTYLLMIADMNMVLMRRRFQHATAIEIFMVNGRSFLINFPHYLSIDIIKRMNLPDHVRVQKHDWSSYFQTLSIHQQWIQEQISNFEYLMQVNIYGGRSFNDASQYPLFPWVISDYEHDTLDLENESTFRDLTKPIGAIGTKRLLELQRRMQDLRQLTSSAYLYSSFVSCPLALYLWLVRMEPFTTLHIDMQSGKFDHSSRLFSSIPQTWQLVTTHMNDYRELPPEFYFQDEFLLNENDFDLGIFRGKPIGNVILPKSAHTSSPEFIYLMRKAFESDYVSSHLSDWIDLLFGYKQTDQAAVDSWNLYDPIIYESAWTKQTLTNPQKRAEIEATMWNVGQIPPKLFNSRHPIRNVQKLTSTLSQIVIVDLNVGEILTAVWKSSELILINNGNLIVFSVKITNEVSCLQRSSLFLRSQVKDIQFSQSFGVIILFTTGKSITFENGVFTPKFPQFRNISTFSFSQDYLVAVSDETTLNVFGPRLRYAIPFYGDLISCCTISRGFGIIVCGTVSGNIVICSLFEGTKVNVVDLNEGFKPLKILITNSWGFIITYASKNLSGKIANQIFVHNVNGRLIRSVAIEFSITAWCTWSSRKAFDYLIVANEQGKLSAFEAFYVNIGKSFHRCHETVVSLSYQIDLGIVVIVLRDGHLVLLPYIVD